MVIAGVFILGAVLTGPARWHRVEAWLRYHGRGEVPPPIIAGLHGRLFLGNHAGDPAGSLITGICTGGPGAVARAAAELRPLLDAVRATAIPARLLIVPTAPRLYPEDLPPPYTCPDPLADRVVAALADPAVLYPVPEMLAMKAYFGVIPRVNFHWAGEAPLHVAEIVGAALGLTPGFALPLYDDHRRSDMDGYNRGMGAESRLRMPSLAGVAVCEGGRRCPAAPMPSIVTYTRPGPGRILVIADSFGDDFARDLVPFAGQVWLLRMNLALRDPPGPVADVVLRGFQPTAIVVVYHDAGALGLDAVSRLSLSATTALLQAGRGQGDEYPLAGAGQRPAARPAQPPQPAP